MGCGCKGDNISSDAINKETTDLNLMSKLLKIPTIIFLTLLILIMSPILIVVVWYVAITSVFSDNFNLIDILLLRFNKNKQVTETEEDDFEEDDYEMVDIDIIK